MTAKDRLQLDNARQQLNAALDEQGRRFRKVGKVSAERVLEPGEVETVLANGRTETTNRAERGDYIVKADTGERWVVKPEAFARRYALVGGAKNVYVARGEVVAVPNPFGQPIEIVAPWGKKQEGDADCMIADEIDKTTGERAAEPYLISRAEFDKTYRRTS